MEKFTGTSVNGHANKINEVSAFMLHEYENVLFYSCFRRKIYDEIVRLKVPIRYILSLLYRHENAILRDE